MSGLRHIALRLLPFADAGSDGLPLRQLLRLSLFQVSVGMAAVMLLGTLNRVMIVELGLPALLVAGMIALPVLIAPFRALLGFRSDTKRSALGLAADPLPVVRGAVAVRRAGDHALRAADPGRLRPDPRAVCWARLRGPVLPDDRPGDAHDADRGAGAGRRPRGRRDAAAGGRASLRGVPGGHAGQRAAAGLAAAGLHRAASDPGGAGHGGRDAGAERGRAVEAGGAAPDRPPNAPRRAPSSRMPGRI